MHQQVGGGQLFHEMSHGTCILQPDHRLFRQERENGFRGDFFVSIDPDIGHDADFLHFLNRKLARRIKRPDGTNLVSDKFNPVWMIIAEGINVNQSSAQGELTRLSNKIGTLEFILYQQVKNKIHVDLLADREFQCVFFKVFLINNLLGNRFRVAYNDEFPGPAVELVEHFRTRKQSLVILDPGLKSALERGWKVVNPVAQDLLKIIKKISGRFFVGQQHQMGLGGLLIHGSGDQGAGGTDKTFELETETLGPHPKSLPNKGGTFVPLPFLGKGGWGDGVYEFGFPEMLNNLLYQGTICK